MIDRRFDIYHHDGGGLNDVSTHPYNDVLNHNTAPSTTKSLAFERGISLFWCRCWAIARGDLAGEVDAMGAAFTCRESSAV